MRKITRRTFFFIGLAILIFNIEAYALNKVLEQPAQPSSKDKNLPKPGQPLVFGKGDKKPQFPGGDAEFNKYIQNNIRVPNQISRDSIEAKVMISFGIDENGKITNPNVTGIYSGKDYSVPVEILDKKLSKSKLAKRISVYALMKNEAIRLIKAMPTWKPCIIKGKKVPVINTIPLLFTYRKQGTNPFGMEGLLTVVNGQPMNPGFDMSTIQSKILSIRILKDSASIAKYGEKAKKGIMDITIKTDDNDTITQKKMTVDKK